MWFLHFVFSFCRCFVLELTIQPTTSWPSRVCPQLVCLLTVSPISSLILSCFPCSLWSGILTVYWVKWLIKISKCRGRHLVRFLGAAALHSTSEQSTSILKVNRTSAPLIVIQCDIHSFIDYYMTNKGLPATHNHTDKLQDVLTRVLLTIM